MKEATAKLREALNIDLTDYQGIPFWSWNNDLDEAKLVEQIEDMKSAGLGGFIMHARIGLSMEYLGEKWFSCIDACLKKAKELGMNAWVYDENGWPSGFVGGKLLENMEFRAQFLRYTVKYEYDADAFGVYVETADGFKRVTEPQAGAKKYHCVYRHISPSNTDILDPAVVDAFIEATHEEYYKRFKDSFGKELVGFFTDEPQYYRWDTPFPRLMAQEFKQRYDEDVMDGLVYLFIQDERGYAFREKYYQICNHLYVNVFYKKLYDWCESHGCKLTGHSVEEAGVYAQMWGGAGCMPSYEYEHIPGMDCLERECSSEIAPKQVGSVAQQLGIKQTLTETFGCAGYDTTPQELKHLGEYQYFNGISLMCHHLYPYSLTAQGKTDHPPVFSKHGNWWEGFKTFNDHFTKLGYIVSNTRENYDVLVIHPMRNVYLNYIRTVDRESVAELEDSFLGLIMDMRRFGVQYQFADETLLKKYGKVEGDKIVIGNCEYSTVIVPNMLTISQNTLDVLQAFKGKMWVQTQPEYIDGVKADITLPSTTSFSEIVENTKIKFYSADAMCAVTSRSGEIGDYIFVKNYSRTDSATVKMQGVANAYKALDLETFATKNITDEYVLPKCGSLILIKDETAKEEKKNPTSENVTENFAVTGISENFFVIDYARYSFDGNSYTKLEPIPQIFDRLLRQDYKGKLFMKHTFTVKETVPVKLVMEGGKYLSVKVNGTAVTFYESPFDFKFIESDISKLVKEGVNEIVYEIDYYQHDGVSFALYDPMATESLRNCLYYDTHIENIYLKGEFIVNADMSLSKPTKMPVLNSKMYQQGYPFFKGTLTVKGSYEYDGNGTRTLAFGGRFAMVKATINGKTCNVTMDIEKDVTEYLQVGNNDITLEIKSSLRNLFGPLHYKHTPELLGVAPIHFTCRGLWTDEGSVNYTDKYNFVPFGVDEIAMIHNK